MFVIAALIAMRIYIKRGYSGYLRGASDSMGGQYHPKATTSDILLESFSNTLTTSNLQRNQALGKDINDDGINDVADVMVTNTVTTTPEITRQSGTETIGPLGNNLWN